MSLRTSRPRAGPEAGEVGGDLHRPAGGRQQVHDERDPPPPRSGGPSCRTGPGPAPRSRAARPCSRPAPARPLGTVTSVGTRRSSSADPVVAEEVAQDAADVDPLEVGAAGGAGAGGAPASRRATARRASSERSGQSSPSAPSGEADAGLQRPGAVAPAQHGEPGRPDVVDEGARWSPAPASGRPSRTRGPARRGGARMRCRRSSRSGSHASVATSSMASPAARLDVGGVERGGHPDAEVVAPGSAPARRVEVGDDQERLAGQRVAGGQPARRAGAQPEAAAAPGLGHPVGVGEGQHRPARGEVVAGGRAGRCRPAGQLAGPPAHRARRPRSAAGWRAPVDDQPQPLGDVGGQLVGPAPEHVALLEQGGQRAGEAAQAAAVGGDDHAGQAGVQGQVGHGPARRGEAVDRRRGRRAR